jgi:hypothetical protein
MCTNNVEPRAGIVADKMFKPIAREIPLASPHTKAGWSKEAKKMEE